MRYLHFKILIILLNLVIIPSQEVFATQISMDRILQEGDPAPGTEAGVTFSRFTRVITNNSNDIAILANVQGPSVDTENDVGIWLYKGGVISLIAREGMQVSGQPTGIKYGGINAGISFNNTSSILFRSTLEGTGQTNAPLAEFFYSNGSTVLILQPGDSAPGLSPSETIGTGFVCRLPSMGENVVCRAGLVEAGASTFVNQFRWATWRFNGSGLELILRDGDPAPGVSGYSMTGRFDFTSITTNDTGELALIARIQDGISGGSIMYRGVPGALIPAVRQGDTLPGLSTDEFVASVGNALISDNGDILFSVVITNTGASVPDEERFGIWVLESNGVFREIIRSGGDAPVLNGGEIVNYGSLFPPTGRINNAGEVTIALNDAGNTTGEPLRVGSRLIGAETNIFNNEAIWHGVPGALDLVIREGDPALDIPGKVYQAQIGYDGSVATNNSGHLAFVTRTSDPNENTNSSDPRALYMHSFGQLENILTTNQNISLVNGETVFLQGLDSLNPGNRTGSGGSINDDGFIVVTGRYRDPEDSRNAIVAIFTIEVDASEPPVADAGPDQSFRPVSTITLNGSNSFDDNTPSADLTYSWSFLSWPGTEIPTLLNSDTAAPEFIADLTGDYEVQLIVQDSSGQSSIPDTVVISSDNLAPMADAGMNLVVLVGTTTTLNGSDSSDPENDPLTYLWSIASLPGSSTANIIDSSSVISMITPDVAGDFIIQLNVSDIIGPSLPSTVTITALNSDDYINFLITEISEQLDALDSSQFVNNGLRNQLTNRLSNVANRYNSGQTSNAISQLEQAIRRVNGCSNNGVPDGNGPERDHIVDCNAQIPIFINMQLLLMALMGA